MRQFESGSGVPRARAGTLLSFARLRPYERGTAATHVGHRFGLILKLNTEGGFGFFGGEHFEGVLGAGIEAGGAGALDAPAMLESRRGAIPSVQDRGKESALYPSGRPSGTVGRRGGFVPPQNRGGVKTPLPEGTEATERT